MKDSELNTESNLENIIYAFLPSPTPITEGDALFIKQIISFKSYDFLKNLENKKTFKQNNDKMQGKVGFYVKIEPKICRNPRLKLENE